MFGSKKSGASHHTKQASHHTKQASHHNSQASHHDKLASKYRSKGNEKAAIKHENAAIKHREVVTKHQEAAANHNSLVKSYENDSIPIETLSQSSKDADSESINANNNSTDANNNSTDANNNSTVQSDGIQINSPKFIDKIYNWSLSTKILIGLTVFGVIFGIIGLAALGIWYFFLRKKKTRVPVGELQVIAGPLSELNDLGDIGPAEPIASGSALPINNYYARYGYRTADNGTNIDTAPKNPSEIVWIKNKLFTAFLLNHTPPIINMGFKFRVPIQENEDLKSEKVMFQLVANYFKDDSGSGIPDHKEVVLDQISSDLSTLVLKESTDHTINPIMEVVP